MKTLWRRYRPGREHLFRMLGAVGLALVVWVYVTISQNQEVSTSFEARPIEVRSLPGGYLLVDSAGIPLSSQEVAQEVASLVARAPQSVRLEATDFDIYVDASEIEEAGAYDLPVEVSAPRQVRTWTVEPQSVSIRVESIQRLNLQVVVQLSRLPGVPYIVGTPIVSPARVTLEGPRSRVEQVHSVEARVDLAGRVISLENVPVTVLAVDSAGNEVAGITMRPAQVSVDVPIVLEGGHRAVSVVPVTAGRPAPGYFLRSIEVHPNTVTIFSGDANTLATLLYLETVAVPITNRSEDFTQTVALRLPANVSLINSPALVTMTVRFGEIEPQLRLLVPVRLSGLGAGLQATWTPEWMNVLIRGPMEVLLGLQLDDLWAVVDVGGFDVGEYDRPLAFPVPGGLQVTPIDPAIVHVVIASLPAPTATVTPTLPITTTVTPTPTPPPRVTPPTVPAMTPTPSPSPEPAAAGGSAFFPAPAAAVPLPTPAPLIHRETGRPWHRARPGRR